jgi:3-methyl-2-oxobutanoate hydroxymethyltransferase
MAVSSLQALQNKKARGERIAMVSLYDAPAAALCCDAGVDVLLVGDSLGNVILGYDNTISVTMDDMLRQSSRPQVPVIADLPFASYHNADRAAEHSAALMRTGAHGVKLEGAYPDALAAVRALTDMGAPVMGHLGFTPQSSLRLQSVVQARTIGGATQLLDDALALQEAGCFGLVLEAVPIEVARQVTHALHVITIGIGAGPHCDGQVLVWHDLVGLTPGAPFRFVKRYADAHALFSRAARDFTDEVQTGAFPTGEHGWNMPLDELEDWELQKKNNEKAQNS